MGWGTVHVRVLIAAAGSELRNSLDTNIPGFQLLSYDALRHPFPEILYQQPNAAILRKGEGLKKITPSLTSRDLRALTVALKPSAVDVTTINSAFSWAVRSQGQDARNQARKPLA
jgi:hypothetical protein